MFMTIYRFASLEYDKSAWDDFLWDDAIFAIFARMGGVVAPATRARHSSAETAVVRRRATWRTHTRRTARASACARSVEGAGRRRDRRRWR